MYLDYNQKVEFLKGTLTPNEVVELVGNDGPAWSELLEFVFKSYGEEKSMKEFANTKRGELADNIGSAQDWFKERIEDAYADSEELTELAEIFGWDTTKEVDVVITITASGTLSVPMGKSVEDAEGDIEVDISVGYGTDGFELDVSTDSVDISEN
jgi:hypothetical protein